MNILGIETSCDDTAAAVLQDGWTLRANIVSSQAGMHANYGGIVPELASRSHMQQMAPVVRAALHTSGITMRDIDSIVATSGPGLAGSLVVGLNMAKGLAFARGTQFLGVNHLQGHVYAAWVREEGDSTPVPDEEPGFPLMCLVVSGGHTDLALMTAHGEFQRVGRTRDDAAGEAFDKAARVLGLGYPGGPVIQKAAETARETDPFPRAWMRGSWDFSFSGLKTAVLNRARELGLYPPPEAGLQEGAPEAAASLARSFQDAVVDVLASKTLAAAEEFGAKAVIVGGGVAANRVLRERLREQAKVPVIIPPVRLCTDNAAMIAAAAYPQLTAGQTSPMSLDVTPGLSIGTAPEPRAAVGA